MTTVKREKIMQQDEEEEPVPGSQWWGASVGTRSCPNQLAR